MSRVNELNDNCFALATDLVTKLCAKFHDEVGSYPTIAELTDLLACGIQSCSKDILADIDPQSVSALTPRMARKSKSRPHEGDVIAVPAGDGGFFLLLYLGLFGHFGHAFGLLRGRIPARRLSTRFAPVPLARPIFTDIRALISGRWKVIASRPEWLAAFTRQPEYYHAKRWFPNNDRIGPYGSAETANNYSDGSNRAGVVDYSSGSESCVLRHLSAEEAVEIGLERKDFFQSGLETEVEAYLQRINTY